jgi:hypothetical protein
MPDRDATGSPLDATERRDEPSVERYEPPTLEDLQHPDGPTGMPAGPGVTNIASPRKL